MSNDNIKKETGTQQLTKTGNDVTSVDPDAALMVQSFLKKSEDKQIYRLQVCLIVLLARHKLSKCAFWYRRHDNLDH